MAGKYSPLTPALTAAADRGQTSIEMSLDGLPDGTEQPLDLSRSAARLLAENAALVAAQLRDDADIVNLE